MRDLAMRPKLLASVRLRFFGRITVSENVVEARRCGRVALHDDDVLSATIHVSIHVHPPR
jgi:hypothetical protein